MKAGSPFWQFSLAFYRRPPVQAACLAMQDEGGADANMILYLLFAAQEGRALAKPSVARMDTFVAQWRDDIVRPLRGVRRVLKSIDFSPAQEVAALRGRIKANELEAERLQQEAMHDFGRELDAARMAPADAAETNLAAYEACLGCALPSRAELLREFGTYSG
ncbi:MAG: TIGR02444 family protein [Alphaproteobacteria bacterium]|nr:TIGR02444 family protein [Alphaproteobacteria bacterium]